MDSGATPGVLFIYKATSGALAPRFRPFQPLIPFIFRHALGEGPCCPWPRTPHVPIQRLRKGLSTRSGTAASKIRDLSMRWVGLV